MKFTLIAKALDDASSLAELLDTFSSGELRQSRGKLVQEACLRLRTRLGLDIPSSARMATRNVAKLLAKVESDAESAEIEQEEPADGEAGEAPDAALTAAEKAFLQGWRDALPATLPARAAWVLLPESEPVVATRLAKSRAVLDSWLNSAAPDCVAKWGFSQLEFFLMARGFELPEAVVAGWQRLRAAIAASMEELQQAMDLAASPSKRAKTSAGDVSGSDSVVEMAAGAAAASGAGTRDGRGEQAAQWVVATHAAPGMQIHVDGSAAADEAHLCGATLARRVTALAAAHPETHEKLLSVLEALERRPALGASGRAFPGSGFANPKAVPAIRAEVEDDHAGKLTALFRYSVAAAQGPEPRSEAVQPLWSATDLRGLGRTQDHLAASEAQACIRVFLGATSNQASDALSAVFDAKALASLCASEGVDRLNRGAEGVADTEEFVRALLMPLAAAYDGIRLSAREMTREDVARAVQESLALIQRTLPRCTEPQARQLAVNLAWWLVLGMSSIAGHCKLHLRARQDAALWWWLTQIVKYATIPILPAVLSKQARGVLLADINDSSEGRRPSAQGASQPAAAAPLTDRTQLRPSEAARGYTESRRGLSPATEPAGLKRARAGAHATGATERPVRGGPPKTTRGRPADDPQTFQWCGLCHRPHEMLDCTTSRAEASVRAALESGAAPEAVAAKACKSVEAKLNAKDDELGTAQFAPRWRTTGPTPAALVSRWKAAGWLERA